MYEKLVKELWKYRHAWLDDNPYDIPKLAMEAAEAIEKLQSELEQVKEEIELYKNTHYKLQYKGEELTASEVGKRLDELEQVKAERETYKMFFDDVTGKPDCNDCGRLECEYKPKVGETTRFNCPLWRGVQGGKGNEL
jgi:predicted nuclease with TOPRIM domain